MKKKDKPIERVASEIKNKQKRLEVVEKKRAA